jgi:ABC-type phosphate transport system substrate-binding protein
MTPKTVTLALALWAGLPAAGMAQSITGAGSTLAAPLYQKWAEAAAAPTGVTLNYQAVGSGAGQKLIFQRTVDFGASDGPVPAAKLAQNALLQFPTVIGAEDVVVNLPGVKADQLRLTGKLVSAITAQTVQARPSFLPVTCPRSIRNSNRVSVPAMLSAGPLGPVPKGTPAWPVP